MSDLLVTILACLGLLFLLVAGLEIWEDLHRRRVKPLLRRLRTWTAHRDGRLHHLRLRLGYRLFRPRLDAVWLDRYERSDSDAQFILTLAFEDIRKDFR